MYVGKDQIPDEVIRDPPLQSSIMTTIGATFVICTKTIWKQVADDYKKIESGAPKNANCQPEKQNGQLINLMRKQVHEISNEPTLGTMAPLM